MYFINSLGLKQKVYDHRPAKPENYNHSAIYTLARQKFFETHMQVLVDSVGGQSWINIPKTDFHQS